MTASLCTMRFVGLVRVGEDNSRRATALQNPLGGVENHATLEAICFQGRGYWAQIDRFPGHILAFWVAMVGQPEGCLFSGLPPRQLLFSRPSFAMESRALK